MLTETLGGYVAQCLYPSLYSWVFCRQNQKDVLTLTVREHLCTVLKCKDEDIKGKNALKKDFNRIFGQVLF